MFAGKALLTLLSDADLDTFTLGQGDPWLLSGALANNEHVGSTGSELDELLVR